MLILSWPWLALRKLQKRRNHNITICSTFYVKQCKGAIKFKCTERESDVFDCYRFSGEQEWVTGEGQGRVFEYTNILDSSGTSCALHYDKDDSG